MGAPRNVNGRGSAFVYVRDENGEWTLQAKLLAPEVAASDNFGHSVGIYGDTVIIGAPSDDSAHLFVRNGTTWTHQDKLLIPDGSADNVFGFSVGIYGETVIVGAATQYHNPCKSGSAHLFVRNGATWTHQTKLGAPDEAAGDRFGHNVGIHGDTVIIGSRRDGAWGHDTGSTHIFVRNRDTWTHQAKLLAPDGHAQDWFGISVGIYGDTVIVGAKFHRSNSGTAHLFVRNGDTWTHQAKLVAPDGASYDYFGVSVGIYAGTVIVGADRYYDSYSGSAHVFVRNGDAWMHRAKLLAPKDGINMFGARVAIYNGTSIVGSQSGEVYVFSG